ncbi:MAG TPA: MOSC domain-containing protein [Candidatus Angelobacter sp.]|nr:MOSC domain-containing protein [Candidatus Angelobacter sp.]
MSVQEKSAVLETQKHPGLRWGVISAIYIGPEARQPMSSVPEVRAVAGAGLEGDRYCNQAGTFSEKLPANQVTLIESEAIAAAARDYKLNAEGADSRCNLLTTGIALNHLVGREFRIGQVRLRGLRLCEPCGHLEKLTGKEMIKALRHRGGLRAEILSGGIIKVGDTISEQE